MPRKAAIVSAIFVGADMRSIFVACIFVFAIVTAALAAPDKRVALVIGNNAYKALHSLANPGLDAQRLAGLLTERGFDVLSCDGKRPGCFDLTREGLTAAIALLAEKSKGASLALVSMPATAWARPKGTCLRPSMPILTASASK